MIDGYGPTGQAGEASSDWMSSEGVDYITACGHKRHRIGSKHPSPPIVSKDGARSDEGTQGETMSETMSDDITIGVPYKGQGG